MSEPCSTQPRKCREWLMTKFTLVSFVLFPFLSSCFLFRSEFWPANAGERNEWALLVVLLSQDTVHCLYLFIYFHVFTARSQASWPNKSVMVLTVSRMSGVWCSPIYQCLDSWTSVAVIMYDSWFPLCEWWCTLVLKLTSDIINWIIILRLWPCLVCSFSSSHPE